MQFQLQDTTLPLQHFLSYTNTNNIKKPSNLLTSSFHETPQTNTLHFSASSSSKTKATTTNNIVSLPPKPSKTREIPSVTPPQPLQRRQTRPPDFQEKLFYLDSIGLDVFSLVDSHRPILVSASIPDVQSTLDLLTSVNFTAPEFRRIVHMCPEILTLNAAAVLPVLTFLLREARVAGSDLKRAINRRPRLLVSSVKHRLRPTLYFLQGVVGIENVSRHTYLLSCSVEDKLLPRIHYFQKIGFARRDAVSMFRRFPQLFNYSVKENVEPKLNYFVVEMGRDLKEIKDFPQFFSFSLERRIKPRHQCCVANGVCFPIHTLLKPSDAQFQSRLEVCCNCSLPLSTSPLSCINISDDDTDDATT